LYCLASRDFASTCCVTAAKFAELATLSLGIILPGIIKKRASLSCRDFLSQAVPACEKCLLSVFQIAPEGPPQSGCYERSKNSDLSGQLREVLMWFAHDQPDRRAAIAAPNRWALRATNRPAPRFGKNRAVKLTPGRQNPIIGSFCGIAQSLGRSRTLD